MSDTEFEGGDLMRWGDFSQPLLRSTFTYDPSTGHFSWRNDHLNCKGRIYVRAGKRAGSLDRAGYRQLGLGGKSMSAHRAAWIYVHGALPEGAEIDHRNGNRSDNRIANLRIATHMQNACNRRCNPTSGSGLKGASLHRETGRWQARIQVGGKRKHLGLFDTAEAAHAAWRAAAKVLHGEFANFGGAS